ncbi:MAG: hypothetical protein WAN50_04465 [Minisyncoccia bacterium]
MGHLIQAEGRFRRGESTPSEVIRSAIRGEVFKIVVEYATAAKDVRLLLERLSSSLTDEERYEVNRYSQFIISQMPRERGRSIIAAAYFDFAMCSIQVALEEIERTGVWARPTIGVVNALVSSGTADAHLPILATGSPIQIVEQMLVPCVTRNVFGHTYLDGLVRPDHETDHLLMIRL